MTTQPDLPEGVDVATVLEHSASIGAMGLLINLTATYMDAPEGLIQEAAAEMALNNAVENIVNAGPEATGRLLLAFASLVVAAIDESEAQGWFDFQAAKIQEALDALG